MKNDKTAGNMTAGNMTVGSEWKKILYFSLPIMIGNLLQQLYNTVDGIVVGNYVGDEALAAVGSCATLTMLFLAIAIGLGGGSGIMIAQYFGAKRMDDLKKAASTALIMLFSLGVLLSILGFFFARGLLGGLMNVNEEGVLDLAATYFSIYAIGLMFQFAYNSIAAVLRSIGDSRATLYFLCVSAGLNVVLDLLFVISFGWGVAGAAVATVISQFICTIVSGIYMVKKYEIFRYKRGEFVFVPEKAKVCLKLGIPNTIQQGVVSFGNIFLQRLVNSFGLVTMAAFTVGMRVEGYLFVTIIGFSTGLNTFTGQNLGAGKLDRISKGHKYAIFMSGGAVIALSALVFIFADSVSSLFGVTGETLARSVEMLRFMACFFIMFSVYQTFTGVLQGAGDVLFSASCTLTSLVVRVVLSYTLAYAFGVGYSSVWITVPFGWGTALIMAILRFRTGKWKTKGVVKPLENGGELEAEA